MGGIRDEHVEWAIVNRLKAMLDEPPQTPFNVTQTFALFSSVLMWSKNRAWIAGNNGQLAQLADPADRRAHGVREAMRGTLIVADPWHLSRVAPQILLMDVEGQPPVPADGINADFEEMSAEAFFKWLRDALAHGDGRTIHPIHKRSARNGEALLAGFRIMFRAEQNAPALLTLHLFHDDMRRLGSQLAELFCRSLSGEDQFFEHEVGTARLREATNAA